MQTEDYCPGTTDFRAIREKTGVFAGVEEDIERTIRNVGRVGTEGMEETDRTILNIMCHKKG